MHSRIFEVSLSPIKELADFENIPEEWISNHCEYVIPDDNPKESLKWLATSLFGRCDLDLFTIAYSYEELVELLNLFYYDFKQQIEDLYLGLSITAWNSERYALDHLLFQAKASFNDEEGFWFFLNQEMLTIQEFILKLITLNEINNTPENQKEPFVLYIGTIWDYKI